MCSTELTVTLDEEKWVHVSEDGEVVTMMTPLKYRIRPKALRVVVPGPE